jgi:hypothetical protein
LIHGLRVVLSMYQFPISGDLVEKYLRCPADLHATFTREENVSMGLGRNGCDAVQSLYWKHVHTHLKNHICMSERGVHYRAAIALAGAGRLDSVESRYCSLIRGFLASVGNEYLN